MSMLGGHCVTTSHMADGAATGELERQRRLLKALSRCRTPMAGAGLLGRLLRRARRKALLAPLDGGRRGGVLFPQGRGPLLPPRPPRARRPPPPPSPPP